MRPKFNHRFWILLLSPILIQCIFNEHHQILTIVNGQTIQKLSQKQQHIADTRILKLENQQNPIDNYMDINNNNNINVSYQPFNPIHSHHQQEHNQQKNHHYRKTTKHQQNQLKKQYLLQQHRFRRKLENLSYNIHLLTPSQSSLHTLTTATTTTAATTTTTTTNTIDNDINKSVVMHKKLSIESSPSSLSSYSSILSQYSNMQIENDVNINEEYNESNDDNESDGGDDPDQDDEDNDNDNGDNNNFHRNDNDNNAEGGGDKEFYSEIDINQNDSNQNQQRYRRAFITPSSSSSSLSSLTPISPSSVSPNPSKLLIQEQQPKIMAASESKVQQKSQAIKNASANRKSIEALKRNNSKSKIKNDNRPIKKNVLIIISDSDSISINDNSKNNNNNNTYSEGDTRHFSNNNNNNDDNVRNNNQNEILSTDLVRINQNSDEQIIILTDDIIESDSLSDNRSNHNYNINNNNNNTNNINNENNLNKNKNEENDILMMNDNADDDNDDDDNVENLNNGPIALPLRPIPSEIAIVYAEQHAEVNLNCDVDLDVKSATWTKDGKKVHTTDRSSRQKDSRFIRDVRVLTIGNVMLEDDGEWQCKAENYKGYVENARPVKLIVLDRPKPPYLLIDSRRLDAGNIFVPVKENSELSLACISESGNPKPTLNWEVLLSPGVDRHTQKIAAEVLELQEIENDKQQSGSYKINSGAKSEAKLPAVFRAHHNARILCVMEHPTLKMRQNASLLLDVQYTPSFAISRTPGFGYPLREGIEVSLKCDVDSNPPSTPLWQKDDGDTPVPQTGDGFLNFSSVRKEHAGWYKCTSKHLNFQYSSIGYFLSVRYDSVDVTSEPLEQDISIAAASHNPNKGPQLEVQLGGAVTLQCPQGSLGCWSHLDPVSARLKGVGSSIPTGQFSLKDVVYQDAGSYKCIGQSTTNKKKLEVLHTVSVQVKGSPTVVARNSTPIAYPGSPLHLAVEFCANPPAYAARWLHGDRIYTPGNQYGVDVLAYGVIDLPIPFCKEARLTYVHMHERVPRTFYFIVSSPGGVAEAIFQVNFTLKNKIMSNSIDYDEEELSEPEEIHFPVFGSSANKIHLCNNLKLFINFICTFLIIGFLF